MASNPPQPYRVSVSDLLEVGRTVLSAQSQALATVAERLSTTFQDSVDAIVQCSQQRGRVIASGIGKAGHIAQKFSATLASTGICSFFVSPSEALHGDLGRFASEDVAVLFSFSGESQEVLAVTPRIKALCSTVIGITQSGSSSLAQLSDWVIEIGPLEECPPLYIAPTSSTTAMLGISDAIAMASCVARGFERSHYSKLHPGGDIGRRLIRVEEIMRVGAYHCIVDESLAVGEVIRRYTMTQGRPGAASVTNANGLLTGIFTDGDLRRLLSTGNDFLNAPVGAVMGRNPKTIGPSATAREALDVLSRLQIDQLVVVGARGEPLGMLDIQDLANVIRILPDRSPAEK